MRRNQLSFAHKFHCQFQQRKCVSQNAIILGNIDNDARNTVELAVGGIGGELAIYKHNKANAWLTCDGLGSINCLALGDLHGCHLNSLIVITGEGDCYVFQIGQAEQRAFTSDESLNKWKTKRLRSPAKGIPAHYPRTKAVAAQREQPSATPPIPIPSHSDASPVSTRNSSRERSLHSEPLPVVHPPSILEAEEETKVGDAEKEEDQSEDANNNLSEAVADILFLDEEKRRRSLQFDPTPQVQQGARKEAEDDLLAHEERMRTKQAKFDRKKRASMHEVSEECEGEWLTASIEPMCAYRVIHNATAAVVGDYDEDGVNELIIGTANRQVYAYSVEASDCGRNMRLKPKASWTVESKVSSVSLAKDEWGRALILVGMKHEGSYGVIDHSGEVSYQSFDELFNKQSSPGQLSAANINGGPIEMRYMQRTPVDRKGNMRHPHLRFMCTLSGDVALQMEDRVVWTLALGQQLFGSTAFDLLGDGRGYLIASSWKGQTYIIDEDGNCVQFAFEERVQAFVAGSFTVQPSETRPCLCFVTYYDEIIVFTDIVTYAVRQTLSPADDAEQTAGSRKYAALTTEELRDLVHRVETGM